MTRSTMRRIMPQLLILAAVLALNVAVFPGFFDIAFQNGRLYGNLIAVLNRGAPTALPAIAITLVIATRGIDLSVGAVMAISGAVAAALSVGGHGWGGALIGARGAGLACGPWNGVSASVLRVHAIVATLVLMLAGRGIAQLITESAIVTFTKPGVTWLGAGAVVGIPTPIPIWRCLGALATITVRRTAPGLLTEAICISETASRLARINSHAPLLTVDRASGVCAAMAGVIVAADIKGADANNAGLWMERDAILAAVIADIRGSAGGSRSLRRC
jgi:ribose/xylose/arabinose/galactoside ABC-type transport system permease subunit